ncbi:hypothetical protein EJ05DRAFT_385229 [Pseudovirgaria hyperparasitica]|uniref:Uncharacterized protein n=1 Tax=Pseudovirgaria hyperparasitica TaxID=470096 RepID=A0A6A6W6U4_9PEZI|nr:uncharacterized protein EJ05DRAFT_385229 [Pseudovirgaria hyperparasitica]KAF2757287.1 hypothetical protein EJ05DRAFT_385229 [Pseudovirgaria hyperparasitica]
MKNPLSFAMGSKKAHNGPTTLSIQEDIIQPSLRMSISSGRPATPESDEKNSQTQSSVHSASDQPPKQSRFMIVRRRIRSILLPTRRRPRRSPGSELLDLSSFLTNLARATGLYNPSVTSVDEIVPWSKMAFGKEAESCSKVKFKGKGKSHPQERSVGEQLGLFNFEDRPQTPNTKQSERPVSTSSSNISMTPTIAKILEYNERNKQRVDSAAAPSDADSPSLIQRLAPLLEESSVPPSHRSAVSSDGGTYPAPAETSTAKRTLKQDNLSFASTVKPNDSASQRRSSVVIDRPSTMLDTFLDSSARASLRSIEMDTPLLIDFAVNKESQRPTKAHVHQTHGRKRRGFKKFIGKSVAWLGFPTFSSRSSAISIPIERHPTPVGVPTPNINSGTTRSNLRSNSLIHWAFDKHLFSRGSSAPQRSASLPAKARHSHRLYYRKQRSKGNPMTRANSLTSLHSIKEERSEVSPPLTLKEVKRKSPSIRLPSLPELQSLTASPLLENAKVFMMRGLRYDRSDEERGAPVLQQMLNSILDTKQPGNVQIGELPFESKTNEGTMEGFGTSLVSKQSCMADQLHTLLNDVFDGIGGFMEAHEAALHVHSEIMNIEGECTALEPPPLSFYPTADCIRDTETAILDFVISCKQAAIAMEGLFDRWAECKKEMDQAKQRRLDIEEDSRMQAFMRSKEEEWEREREELGILRSIDVNEGQPPRTPRPAALHSEESPPSSVESHNTWMAYNTTIYSRTHSPCPCGHAIRSIEDELELHSDGSECPGLDVGEVESLLTDERSTPEHTDLKYQLPDDHQDDQDDHQDDQDDQPDEHWEDDSDSEVLVRF